MSEEVIEATLAPIEPPTLSAAEADELLARVTDLARSKVDLPAGLRAAAESNASPKLAKALRYVAEQVALGQSPEAVLAQKAWRLTPYIAGAVAAAMRSGNSATVLSEIAEMHAELDDAWREVWSAIAYPLVLCGLTFATFVFMLNVIPPGVETLFENGEDLFSSNDTNEFGSFAAVLWLRSTGQFLIFAWLSALAVVCLFVRFVAPKGLYHRARAALPMIGKIFHWSGLVEATRILKLLVERGIPLPEALRLAADGLRDQNIAIVLRRVAQTCAQGTSLAQALSTEPATFPASIVPLVELGERTGRLPEVLRSAADFLRDRLRGRTDLCRDLGPPLVFMLIACLVISFPVLVYVAPLSKMIVALSYWNPRSSSDVPDTSFANLIMLLPLALALTVSRRLIYGLHRPGTSTWLESVLLQLERSCWFVVVLGFCLATQTILSLLLVIAGIYVLTICYFRYYEAERRSLLNQLAAAAQHGASLVEAARSRWHEQNDRLGRKSGRLAERLEQGLTLSDALARAKIRMPLAEEIAVQSAIGTGQFGGSLEQALNDLATSERDRSGTTAQFSYLCGTMLMMMAILAFVMLKIVPVFAKMFEEFGLRLPAPTQLLINLSSAVVRFWPITGLACMLTLVFMLVTFNQTAFRLVATVFPPLELLRIRQHGAWLLRAIATLVRQGQPLPQSLHWLASNYPVRSIGRRIERVVLAIEQGNPSGEMLRRFGFVAAYDAAILAAAERNRHLPWALDNVATSIERRRSLQWRFVGSIVFPTMLVLLGLFVGFVFVALFKPLIAIIEGLAQ